MKRFSFLLAMLLTSFLGISAAENDFGELVLGQSYTLKLFAANVATFTAQSDGVLTYSSDNTDELRPYTSADYQTEVTQFNRTGAAGGFSGQHTYDINVTAGTTYYFYLRFCMNVSTFHIDMAGEATVECTSTSPEMGGKYNLTDSGGQMSFSFNKPVTYTSATLQIANGMEQQIAFRTTSNSLFTNDIQSLVWKSMNDGTAVEGDTMVVTIHGIALQSDPSVKYGGDGVLVAKYALDRKPISLLSTENFTTGSQFLSYYTTSNDKGIVQLHFDGKILGGENLTASLRYGDLDKSADGEYYCEYITPTLSDDSTSIIINLQGTRRRPADMLPEAVSGTTYDNITMHVSGVKDQYGNYAYSDGQGTLGSYDCIYQYKLISADVAVEFTPCSGSDITDEQNIEVWIDDEPKLTYDGILFTYGNSKLSSRDSVLVTDIQKEVDPECPTARILTFAIPHEVLASDEITVSFQNLQSEDGMDYNEDLTATYTSRGIKGDVNGDGLVDIADVNVVLTVIFSESGYYAKADVNGDGFVDIADVNAILSIMFE